MYLQCRLMNTNLQREERIEENTVLLYLIRFLSIYFMHKVNSLVCLPMYLQPTIITPSSPPFLPSCSSQQSLYAGNLLKIFLTCFFFFFSPYYKINIVGEREKEQARLTYKQLTWNFLIKYSLVILM